MIKTIKDYPNYLATSNGKIYSKNKKRFIKTRNKNRCITVFLSYDGLTFEKSLGKLIYEAFYGETLKIVSHKDGNISNNALNNLYLIDKAEQAKKATSKRKYNYMVVNKIDLKTLELQKIELNIKQIGKVSYQSILNVINFKNISHKGSVYFKDREFELMLNSIHEKILYDEMLLNDYSLSYKNTLLRHIKRNEEILRRIKNEYGSREFSY